MGSRRAAGQNRLAVQRKQIAPLLVPSAPADARAAYYALAHDGRRVQLTLHTLEGGQVDGFAAVCQTGRDLFVPLVILRTPVGAVEHLLREALLSGRTYDVVAPPELRAELERTMLLNEQHINRIYEFDPSAYRSVLNVMVQPGQGDFRYEIRSGDRVVSAAGVNWRSARMAEMYVYSEPEVRNRGWDRAVGAACVRALLEKHLLPLYVAPEGDAASHDLPNSLGFRDIGAREFEGRGRLRD
jgi:hypothetical protein